MGKATQDLRHEHQSVLYVLQLLDRMIPSHSHDPAKQLHHYHEVVYFLKIFVDQCHHGKEENHLFKELVDKGIANEGGPIGVMLIEHSQGRALLAEMESALENERLETFEHAAVRYRDLLRMHIEKENNVLFMQADRVLDEESQELLFEQFELHEELIIGHGVHEQLHAMIDRWAEEFQPVEHSDHEPVSEADR